MQCKIDSILEEINMRGISNLSPKINQNRMNRKLMKNSQNKW